MALSTLIMKDQFSTTDCEILDNAQKCLDDEAFQSAIAKFQTLLSEHPDLAEAQIGLGDGYFGLGNYEMAESAYRTGLEIACDNADGLFGLAATLRVGEIFDEAIDLYERAFEIEPDRTGAYWELAYSREMNGNIIGAEEAYRACIKHHPNHGMAIHLLSAMLGKTTDRAPDDYVRDLFDDYADSFERDLVSDLNYVVPQLIKKELEQLPAADNTHVHRLFDNALDLGCGTGLVSLAIKGLVRRIDGVDLSQKMIAIARKERRYTNLYLREMTAFLSDQKAGCTNYDLIICGDSLVYLGELGSIFRGIAVRLEPGGIFCFTLENLRSGSFKLCRTGRYAHSQRYVTHLAGEVGLSILASNQIVPRTDSSVAVSGHLYVMSKTLI